MSKLIDLTGQNFGYWKVLRRGENDKSGHTRWICECQNCGTIKEVQGSHLRSGKSTNCGCIRSKKMRQANIKDETGKVYQYLKVIREATDEEKPRKDRHGIYWNCTCLNCGKENVIVFGDYLRNGDTKSCGCLLSINESNISKMLDKLNIKYLKHYSFNDLKNKDNKNYLPFDFAILDKNKKVKYIIEYDGEQHFHLGHFKNTFVQTHKNDLIKNEYCFKNNIPIIRIPYDKEYSESDLLLETTNFLLTKNNEEFYYRKLTNKND